MTRFMYDADRPGDIPRNAEMVAGYEDGSWSKWDPEWWDWFPNSKHVRISAVGATWKVHVFDVEPDAIWPPENVLPLIVTARANGLWPSVYCNQKNHWAYIRNMFRMRGLVEPPYWVANYDGVAEIPDGAVAKQFKHPPQNNAHFDLSIVADRWPGVDYMPGEENEEMASFCTLVLPATDGPDEIREIPIGLPDVAGATSFSERYVHLHAGNADTRIVVAHWRLNDGNLAAMLDDDTTIPPLGRTSGILAPRDAHCLVLDYTAPLGLSAVIEVK